MKKFFSVFVIFLFVSLTCVAGYYTCKRCNGSGAAGTKNCHCCNGAREKMVIKDCSRCGGTSYVRDAYGDKQRCTACSNGKVSYTETCSCCGGSGEEPWICPVCNGSGQVYIQE